MLVDSSDDKPTGGPIAEWIKGREKKGYFATLLITRSAIMVIIFPNFTTF